MSFETTPMIAEINEVVSGPAKPVHFIWRAELLLPDGTVVYPAAIQDVDEVSDHHNNYTDVVMLSTLMFQGDLDYRIYPNKDNVIITLVKTPVLEAGVGSTMDYPAQRKVYKAILVDSGSAVVADNDPDVVDEETANQRGMVPAVFQLMDRAIDQLRFSLTGGIFNENTTGDVLTALLSQASKDVNLPVSEMPKGVDMVEPDNSRAMPSINIRQGIRLVDLADHIQENQGGIYNSGMGYFYCRGVWYVYPEYNVNIFDRARRQITVLNVPANKYPNIERSYREDGNNITVISTGQVQYTDYSEKTQLNLGNGVRFANADGYMDNFAKVSGNKATLDRGAMNNEFEAFSRADGASNVPVSGERITSNRFAQMSMLASRNLAVLSVVWENSNSTLISPGMGLKYRYVADGKVREINGILAGLQTHHMAVGNAINADRYKSTTTLNFFVSRSLKW